MKRYFKLGIAAIIPFVLVAWAINFGYSLFNDLLLMWLPETWGYQWWYVLLFIIALALVIFIIGFSLSFIKPLRWFKVKLEKWIIGRIPIVNKLYSFGLEISDALIEDGKLDGDIRVAETIHKGSKMLGLITHFDMEECWVIMFIPTCPNPLNGDYVKKEIDEYTIMDMTIEDFTKITTSLGKLGAEKWN